MSGFVVLLEVVLIFGVLGFLAFYATKKVKEKQSQIVGSQGKMHVEDTMSLSLDTKAYIMETYGEKYLVVVGAGGNTVTKLGKNDFTKMMKGELNQTAE